MSFGLEGLTVVIHGLGQLGVRDIISPETKPIADWRLIFPPWNLYTNINEVETSILTEKMM